MLTQFQQQLLNDYQHDFPLTARPYQAIAQRLGVSEAEVLNALELLSQQKLISRVGATIKPNQIGKSMLVAMAVPEDELSQVADIINHYPEVNHNYERDNRFNLWFVLNSDNENQLAQTLTTIEQQTGYPTMRLPLVADYFINLGFNLKLDTQHGCH